MNGRSNALNPPGRNIYTRAATQRLLPGAVAERVFQKYTHIIGKQKAFTKSYLMFQFFHPDKLNSVANDATSHNTRGLHGNVLIYMVWEGDEERKLLGEAKDAAEAIREEFGEYGEGAVAYGNAGGYASPLYRSS